MATTDNKDKKLKDELAALMGGLSPTSPHVKHADDAGVLAQKEEALVAQQQSIISERKRKEMNALDVKFKAQARGVIESMYDFYLDMGVIDKPDYLERRKAIDGLGLSSIFLQLKQTKEVLNTVVDQINSGNVQPRMIEAYTTINGQFSELIRNQANYLLFLEESYKKSKSEVSVYNMNKPSGGSGGGGGQVYIESDSDFYVTADVTKLVEEIKNNSPVTYEEAKGGRVEYMKKYDDVKSYIDPNNKSVLLETVDVDPTIIEDDGSSNMYGDLLDMI